MPTRALDMLAAGEITRTEISTLAVLCARRGAEDVAPVTLGALATLGGFSDTRYARAALDRLCAVGLLAVVRPTAARRGHRALFRVLFVRPRPAAGEQLRFTFDGDTFNGEATTPAAPLRTATWDRVDAIDRFVAQEWISRLGAIELKVWLAYAHHANAAGVASLSPEQLAAAVGHSRPNHACAARVHLVALGLLGDLPHSSSDRAAATCRVLVPDAERHRQAEPPAHTATSASTRPPCIGRRARKPAGRRDVRRPVRSPANRWRNR
ncbi:MAG TPA: hypothetical protein VF624_18830 [Tepidisphaeraceae bacterium]|jgi:hypothetical protein